MGTGNESKLNNLMRMPRGIVLTSRWLLKRGYSYELQRKYRENGWLKSVGAGAMIKKGERVEYLGAIHSLQHQLLLSIHPGGKTALSLLGKAHYLTMGVESVYLYGKRGEKLPAWFMQKDWGVKVNYYASSIFPANLGLIEIESAGFKFQISNAARAMMECLYLSPREQDLMECYNLMLGLNNLRPDTAQELLEACNSIKVKRLFLYLAEKVGHSWFDYLDLDRIDIGKGSRHLTDGGVFIPKYKITVPVALEQND